jgi:hypothetical protein
VNDHETRRRVAEAMARVETLVAQHFPEVLDPLKGALAVVAVGSLGDNTQPTSLIFVGRSGAGKTMVLDFLMPQGAKDPLNDQLYRSDNFTAASFVSHRADLRDKRLQEIDLLPRIREKTMLTKELAPLFAGKEHELTERFARLTSVLDGDGYIADSGAQGRRGYDEKHNFQWLGATTPLSPEAIEVMARLGPRLLFYDADRPRKCIDALIALARGGSDGPHKKVCRDVVRALLVVFLGAYPAGSVGRDMVTFDGDRPRWLALWADVLVRLRVPMPPADVNVDRLIEHPERVLGMLRNIAIGSALVHGRDAVEDYDLAQIAHVALSSGVATRGLVFRAVLGAGGVATTPEVEALADISAPTARHHMSALEKVGLADFTDGRGSTPGRVTLRDPYKELRGAPLLKGKRGEGGLDEFDVQLKGKRGGGETDAA